MYFSIYKIYKLCDRRRIAGKSFLSEKAYRILQICYHDDPHAYKLNYLEGVGYHSIISRGGKSGDMYNEFIVK